MAQGFKFVLGFLVYSFTLAVVLAAGTFWWGAQEFRKPGPLAQTAFVDVPRGSSLGGIAALLTEKNILPNPYIFMAGALTLGEQSNIKAGEYEILPGASPASILDQMVQGRVYERRFTVPEGLTSFEIVNILNAVSELQGEIADLPGEGTLLPETYDYRRDETRTEIIGRMQAAMDKILDELWAGRAASLPLATKEEALTLASIVEKETGVAEERKRVAGVFINRLRQNIPLQTDPSVIYALTGGKPDNKGQGPLGRRLLAKDLEFQSPYNTYLHPGLPPGPIANPGRASIEAVLHPEEHDFLYFVADGRGGHIFAKTLDEHSANVREWRKIRRKSALSPP